MPITVRLFVPACTALLLTAAAAISFARGAEFAAGDLLISAAWARATPPGVDIGAAYLRVENRGNADDRLLSAEADFAGSITVHQTLDENGVTGMRPLPAPAIPAGAALEMQPGGIHLMLADLVAPLATGEQQELTLTFERAGRITVPLDIVPLVAPGPGGAPHDHGM